MLSIGLQRVWPIHIQHLCPISCSTGIWHVRCNNIHSLLMISGHQTPTILLRQLLTKVCIFFVVVTVVLLVDYIRTFLVNYTSLPDSLAVTCQDHQNTKVVTIWKWLERRATNLRWGWVFMQNNPVFSGRVLYFVKVKRPNELAWKQIPSNVKAS